MSEYDGKVVFGMEVDASGVEESVRRAAQEAEQALSEKPVALNAEVRANVDADGAAQMSLLADETGRAAAYAAENAVATAGAARQAERTAEAMMKAWASAASVGSSANGMSNAMRLACAAAQKLPSAIASLLGKLVGSGSQPQKHAVGLDVVPYDEYPALLHRGEMVLNAAEASAYRLGSEGRAAEASVNYDRLESLLQNVTVELDGRTVGSCNAEGMSLCG